LLVACGNGRRAVGKREAAYLSAAAPPKPMRAFLALAAGECCCPAIFHFTRTPPLMHDVKLHGHEEKVSWRRVFCCWRSTLLVFLFTLRTP